MRRAECPASQCFTGGLELRTAHGRNIPVNHLALIIYQQAHMDHLFRRGGLRRSLHLGWFNLAQEVMFCLLWG